MSSSQRVVACAMLLFLQSAHGFVAGPTNNPASSIRSSSSSTSSSQLSMSWTLPNPQDSFKPTWTYQEVGNPTARRVVYDDSEFDYFDDDNDEFYVASFGSDWSATATYDVSDVTAVADDNDDDTILPRGARIGRAARRAIQGLRNTLRP